MSAGSNNRRLRAGIVGGGRGAFIGSVHRIAAELDGQALVVAGAMSADAATARSSAAAWFLERSYDSYDAMAREEAAREDGIDFVIVATPNHMHFPVVRAFLEAGIHVVCDKPLAFTLAEGEELVALVERGRPLFALTHNYTGYPAVRQARALVRAGALGELRKVLVEYNQDWLMTALENAGNKQAEWRTDPARAGLSCCVGDIGSHAAEPAGIHHRPAHHLAVRRPEPLRRRSPARRRRQHPAATQRRREGHAGLLAGGLRRRKQSCASASMARRADWNGTSRNPTR